jgi:hypothetical protein
MTRYLLLGSLLLVGCSDDSAPAADLGRTDVADSKPWPVCASVVVAFTGTVATVAKTPLGFTDAVRTTAVGGSIAYRPCLVDGAPADPKRGEYDHRGGGDFALTVGGKAITGSGNPVVTVEDLSPDTFRFRDGPQLLDKDSLLRQMKVDGVPAAGLNVSLAITDSSGAAFASDALPSSFPMLGIKSLPHTFWIEDSGGTLLLQLDSMTQK